MKYNVGDKIRIKDIDWYNENKDANGDVWCFYGVHKFTKEMSKFCGKTVTISMDLTGLTGDGEYLIKEDDETNWWTDDMIEGLAEETTIKIKDLRKFINQMEIEGLNDETVLTFETKRSSEHIENITSMEYSPTTNILIFS